MTDKEKAIEPGPSPDGSKKWLDKAVTSINTAQSMLSEDSDAWASCEAAKAYLQCHYRDLKIEQTEQPEQSKEGPVEKVSRKAIVKYTNFSICRIGEQKGLKATLGIEYLQPVENAWVYKLQELIDQKNNQSWPLPLGWPAEYILKAIDKIKEILLGVECEVENE
jgi:hypothetical protein